MDCQFVMIMTSRTLNFGHPPVLYTRVVPRLFELLLDSAFSLVIVYNFSGDVDRTLADARFVIGNLSTVPPFLSSQMGAFQQVRLLVMVLRLTATAE